jgi:hypothetical protein
LILTKHGVLTLTKPVERLDKELKALDLKLNAYKQKVADKKEALEKAKHAKFIKTIGKVSPENLDLLIEFASKATNDQFEKLKEIIS